MLIMPWVAHPENGMVSVDEVLKNDLNLSITHEDIVADWFIANLLDSPEIYDGQFGYYETDIFSPDIENSYTRSSHFPVDIKNDLSIPLRPPELLPLLRATDCTTE